MPVFVKDFTEVDLIDNILFVEHNLSDSVIVAVYDDANKQILPDEIEIINSNSLKIHLQSFALRNTSYKASVLSGSNSDGSVYDDTEVRALIQSNATQLEDTYDKAEVDGLLQGVRPLPANEVKYIPQILTEEQKEQARVNLGIVATSGGGGGESQTNVYFESFELGSISFSTGELQSNTTRARSNLSGFEKTSLYFPSGWRVSLRAYASGEFYDGDTVWSSTIPYDLNKTMLAPTSVDGIRVIMSKGDDSTITTEDLEMLKGSVYYTSSTANVQETGTSINITTLPAPIDIAREYKANTSLHLKCSQDINWDDMDSRAERYLYHDTDFNFYIADTPKGRKQWIFKWNHILSPSYYTMAFVGDGDLIAVYRTELEPDRLPDGATPRQNPLFFKRSTGYAMSTINFTAQDPPSAWIANQGFQYVARENAYYMVEYGRPSLYTSKMWRISGDASNASNWKVIKQFDVSADPSSGFKHCHTAQHDPFSGYTYLTTGDDDSAAAIYVTKDDGATVDLVYGPSEKYCRLLNFAFTKEFVYWATDSGKNGRHSLFKAARDVSGVIDVANVEILHDFPYLGVSGGIGVATYATIYMPLLNVLIFMERCDGASSLGGTPVYLWDISTSTMQTLDIVLPVYGDSTSEKGFRCDYYELSPQGNSFSVGFGYHASAGLMTSNKNKVLDNRYATSGLGNIIITIDKIDGKFTITYDTVR